VRCDEEQYTSARNICEVWLANGSERYLVLGSMMALMCFGCCSFWFGKNLYQCLGPTASGISPQVPIPIVCEVVDYPAAARPEQGNRSAAARSETAVVSSSAEQGEASLANASGSTASQAQVVVAPAPKSSNHLRLMRGRRVPGGQGDSFAV